MLFTNRSVYPTNDRPSTNIDPMGGPKNFKSGYAKANPLKQWRKQLIPTNPVSSKQISISQTINPSVSIIQDQNCNIIYNQTFKTSTCLGVKTENGCIGGTNNVRRSGSTIVLQNYSTSTKQYLQKRGKSFEQNYSIGKEKENPVYYSTIPSYQANGEICKTVIYKPSNDKFKTQGAVTSAGYTARIKNDYSEVNKYNPSKKKEQPCCNINYTMHL